MTDKKRWYKLWWVWLLIFISIVLVTFGVPIIIDYVYKLGDSLSKPNTHFSASDLLSYYGSVFSFIGTVLLGGLALWQNSQYKKQADEFSELQLKPYINILNSNANGSITTPAFKISQTSNNSLSSITLRLQNVGVSNILDIKCKKYFIDNNDVEITLNNYDKMHYIAANDMHIIEMPWKLDTEQIICIFLNICNAIGSWYLVEYRLKISRVNNNNIFSGKIVEIKKLKEINSND